MRLKGNGRAPDPESPWNEIVPGLFMGGHRWSDGGLVRPVVVGREFDVVVSLYRRDGCGPEGGVEHHCREMPDGPLTAEQLRDVEELAEVVMGALRAGRRILVRCHSGYNRSGLVVAQTLVGLGYSVDDAVFLVRRHRSKWALNNRLFVDYLTTGLGVAGLLVGLGE